MNIQQCRYVIAIAEYGSFREAAKQLYVAQSSLSSSIKELENELAIEIFNRSQRGVELTEDGAEFLEHANKILSQIEIIEGRYQKNSEPLKRFSVSSQHYDFASEAFSKIVSKNTKGYGEYRFFETNTLKVLEDVKNFESEIGILYLSEANQKVIKQYMKDFRLEFTRLGDFHPHVFLGIHHPLAQKKNISIEDLEEFPLIRFSQEGNSSDHFSEDILEPNEKTVIIYASDRGTVVNFLTNTNSYLLGSGILRSFVKDKLVVLPLNVDQISTVGWIRHQNRQLSDLGESYIRLLENAVQKK